MRVSSRLRLCLSALIFLLVVRIASAEPVEVEGQPLASNVRRLIHALEYLGAPRSKQTTNALLKAISVQDAAEIQRVLDNEASFQVNVSKTGKIKIEAKQVALQQSGFTPLIVKVVNEAASNEVLKLVSPNAGPVYAGVSRFSLQRQQQTELHDVPGPDSTKRFLAVQMFHQSPMNSRLSGLRVEYQLALVHSSRPDSKEAVIGFELSHNGKPQTAKSKVQLKTQRAVKVTLKINDTDGRPTMGKFTFRDAGGHIHPPQSLRLAPDLFFQPQIYRADGEHVWLAPGRYTVHYSRGPEYRVKERKIEIPDRDGVTLQFELERWIHLNALGYFSGDHHIHAAGCAHYTNPTQGIEPQDMFRQVKGEGLNIGCVLTWGPCFDHQRNFFSPSADKVSEGGTILKYDLEISGFGSQALGHVCLLNLKNQTYPGSEGRSDRGWPTWTTPVLRWAKEQGGVTGYAHSGSGLAIDPQRASDRLLRRFDQNKDGRLSKSEAKVAVLPEVFQSIDRDRDNQLSKIELVMSHNRAKDRLPNLAIPEMNGVGAMEICVSVSEGVCDFISAMDTPRIAEWNMWYHILNCGYPLKVSGETDFPCMSSRRVGQGRVYVKLPRQKLAFKDWVKGLGEGRSYVSDGFAHPVDFAVAGSAPGTKDVKLRRAGNVEVTARVAFAEETPLAVAHGGLVPPVGRSVLGDTKVLHGKRSDRIRRGGARTVELVVNGRVVDARKIPADGKLHSVTFNRKITKSSWVAIRNFPQFHTNPVNVIVDGKPIRASRSSARWCAETIRTLWSSRKNQIAPNERQAAKQTFDRAIQRFEVLADES